VEQPRQPPLPAGGGRPQPVAPQVHSLHGPLPPRQEPRRHFSPNHRRPQAARQGNAAGRAERQPRARGAPPPREAERAVRNPAVTGPLRHENGQGIHSG